MKERGELYEFGDFRLDVGERQLVRLDGTGTEAIPEKAFQTLVHLVRFSGRLVEKEELLSTVWSGSIVEENNLGKAVHAIRKCLGEQKGGSRYIETVPKHGYRFVAKVTAASPGDQANGNGTFTGGRKTAEIVTPEPLLSPAYDLYLRGKVKAGSENRKETEEAIKVLEAAVAIDPTLAGAYAQLARAYKTLAFKFSSTASAKVYYENAEVAILKALALDPDLAEGHFARGLILWTNVKGFPHEQAIESYRRALALDPEADETHHQLSMVYSHIGLLDEAQESLKVALSINPNNTMARFRAAVYTAYQGRAEDAIVAFKSVPGDVSRMLVDRCKAEALIQAGHSAQAEKIIDDYLMSNPDDEGGSFTSVKALLLAKSGKRAKAEDHIRRAINIGEGYGHFHHTAHNIASTYAAVGNPEKAVEWLERAADDGFPNYTYFLVDPNLGPVRDHPRFEEFMNGLRARWEHFKTVAVGH